ncbi:hypothetical protein Tco_0205884 [Tanacetum coccineum]
MLSPRRPSISPFFILALEALNVEILEATENNIFKAINVGKDKIQVSHLQFMNDALIMGDKLFGNWVSNIELNVVASSLGCLASEFPCSYLGLPIGSQMSRGGDDVGSVWQRGKKVCGGGEDGDMVLMIDSAVMWMMVEGGVARLEWPEVSPDKGRRRREML